MKIKDKILDVAMISTVKVIMISLIITGGLFLPGSVAAEPLVTAVSPTDPFIEAVPGIIIDGSGFSSAPTVYLTKYNDWDNPGVKIAQVLTGTPGDSQIEFTVTTCGLNSYTPPSPWDAYLWVVDDAGVHSATGFTVQLGFVRDNTPPGASSFQDGQSSPRIYPPGGYISQGLDDAYPILPSVFDMGAKFYEPSMQSPVGCYYSLDDGLNWTYLNSTSPMSTGAVYCSKSGATAPDGPVAIKMSACSPCGGCGQTITKNRVVDKTGPEPGVSFTVTPGESECSLSWSSTTDSGIGMDPSVPYSVYMQTDSFTIDPPGTCSGFNIYTGAGTSKVHSPMTVGRKYYYKLCYKDAYDNISSYDANPVECVVPGIILSSAVVFDPLLVKGGEQDIPVNGFSLKASVGSSTVTALTVTNYIVPHNTSSISEAKLFRDNGTTPDELDGLDEFLSTATFTEASAIFTGLNIPISTSPEKFIITYSIVENPTHGAFLRAAIGSITADYPYRGGSSSGLGLTVDTVAPTTTFNLADPAYEWLDHEATVTFYTTEGPVDSATGIYGCFGSGCTPVVLGGNSMISNCGDGNKCTDGFSYYSVDTVGNTEAVNTVTGYPKIDRKPPSGSSAYFTAEVVFGPKIYLEWGGFIDVGVGLRTDFPYRYRLLRGTDGIPSEDGCPVPTGNTNSTRTNDTSYEFRPSAGQLYGFRLCVFDKLGNFNADFTATATWGTLPPGQDPGTCATSIGCPSCHEMPPDPVHPIHMGFDCMNCHRDMGDPSHVDGIVTINPESGANTGDFEWPAPPGMSCGGFGMPIGGDQTGGIEGCHMGTSSYPTLKPENECFWDETRTCFPPAYDDCNACHGDPVGSGATGFEYDPGAHGIHSAGPDCMACHSEMGPDPSHDNSTINIDPSSGWNGPSSRPWPGSTGMTCGGIGNPIGCHDGGLPSNPAITSEWECGWGGGPPICDPPP